MNRATEPFTRIPHRIFHAQERGELTPGCFLVLVRLCFRCWRDRGETSFTLRALSDEIGWTQSSEKLRQDLNHLHDAGWVTASSPRSGSRKPWLVRLKQANNLQPQPALKLELRPNADAPASGAIPVRAKVLEVLEAPTALGPTEQNRRDKREDQKQPELTSSIDPGWIGPEFGVALEIARLLEALPDADDGTKRVLESLQLPAAAYAAARDEIKRKSGVRNKTGYAVSVLKSWIAQGLYEPLGKQR